jgi:hypothetical protein
MTDTTDERRITYCCGVCNRPVRPGTGCIWVSSADRSRYRDAYAIRNLEVDANQPSGNLTGLRVISGSALMNCPDKAPWRVNHAACDPEPDDNGYWFDVGRADTYERLLSWTVHLVDQDWVLDETNWTDFVRKHMSAKALGV